MASAPPSNARLGPAVTPPWNGVDPGAHLAHLTGTTLRANPVACNDCHAVPTTYSASGAHRNGVADVTFGSLARTDNLVPTWNTTVPLGCAATYCHGDGMASGGGTMTRPTWNGGAAQAACGTCHAETDDLVGLVQQMESRGFIFRKPIQEDKAFKYVMISGPDELLIELFECHEPGRWRIRTPHEDH